MNKTSGNQAEFALMATEGTSVRIGYGLTQVEGDKYEWYEVDLPKKQYPIVDFETVRNAILADINARTDAKILSGFVWNDKPVWLSGENQFNFKAAYDVAVQTEGASLPVKFKLGETQEGEPVYHTFTSLNAFTDFYTKAIAYINQCLQDGWTEKDGIDWTPYQALFPEATQEGTQQAAE